MDVIVENFTNMRITNNTTTKISTPKTDLICALYLENKRLKQEIAHLKALIFPKQQPNVPHWVK